MISTLTPSLMATRTAPAQPQPAICPEPCPEPCPPPQTDGVSLASIDTPVKAAQLPIMDPAVLGGIVAGAVATAMGGGVSAYLTAALSTGSQAPADPGQAMEQRADASFIFDAKNEQRPLTEGGVCGGRFVSNAFTFDQDARTVKYGGPYDELVFSNNDGEQAVHVDGHLGSVETHLVFTAPELGKSDDTLAVHVEGTLGDQAYLVDTTFALNGKPTGNEVSGIIASRGSLGDAPISKDYTFSMSQDGSAATLLVNGGGINAGVPQTVTVEAHVGR